MRSTIQDKQASALACLFLSIRTSKKRTWSPFLVIGVEAVTNCP
ncbi:FIG01116197: hypothetical protein [Streptococcus pyogenes]|nr:FIG01116197: hypothetical protein [Streptococcus pyogenes]